MTNRDWEKIRGRISDDIAKGQLSPGDRLPTEPVLAELFGVGRHSVRRAIADLAIEGLLSVEQGRGTFVEVRPMLEYAVGKRTRLRRNLGDQVDDITRVLLGSEIIMASSDLCAQLRLDEGAQVSHARRMTLADRLPIAFGSSWHCAARFPNMLERRAIFGSMTETYESFGINDYVRAETSVHARPAQPDEARMLRQHPDMPVIIIRAVDALTDGTPISVSEVVWSSARVKFTFGGDSDV